MNARLFWIAILITINALVGCATTPPTELAPTLPPTPTHPPSPQTNAAWTPTYATFNDVEMALVPPGCFIMGSEDGRRDERPSHEQCFDKAFWIDRFEVTNAQYGSTGRFEGADRPRENLLWSEAHDFCIARGAHLPTEAEWEYAARGVDGWLYPWGNTLDPAKLVFDQNSNGETAAVGSKPDGASWVGALDMSGNVFEFVSTAYARYPYDATDGREDVSDLAISRIYRGGINSYIDNGASTTIRFRLDAGERNWFVGFRCALVT